MAIDVDASRDRGTDVDHPSPLPAALAQAIEPDIGVGATVQRPVAEEGRSFLKQDWASPPSYTTSPDANRTTRVNKPAERPASHSGVGI